MAIILIIILSAIIGVGGGYGAFTYTKTLQPPITKEVTASSDLKAEKEASLDNTEPFYYESKKPIYDNDELTKEGAKLFLKLRAQTYGLSEDRIDKVLKTFDRVTSKLPVPDAFKIVVLKFDLMEFREFTEPKLYGL
jgi:hypothetical protein